MLTVIYLSTFLAALVSPPHPNNKKIHKRRGAYSKTIRYANRYLLTLFISQLCNTLGTSWWLALDVAVSWVVPLTSQLIQRTVTGSWLNRSEYCKKSLEFRSNNNRTTESHPFNGLDCCVCWPSRGSIRQAELTEIDRWPIWTRRRWIAYSL